MPGSYKQGMQLLHEEPSRESIGPYISTDANVRTTKTRGMCYLPYGMMEPLLGTDLIMPVLVNAGLEATCGDLIIFLTISLVEPSATRQEPWTLQPQAVKAGYVPVPMATSYRREHVLYCDLPVLRPGLTATTTCDPALVDVARCMRYMVAEVRSERNDRLDHCEEDRCSRTVREKLGETITDRLFLLCQAIDDDNLPRLYCEWAVRTRGVSERYVFQQAVVASCAVLNIPVFDVTLTKLLSPLMPSYPARTNESCSSSTRSPRERALALICPWRPMFAPPRPGECVIYPTELWIRFWVRT
jgi:hypothetical protein